MTPGSFKSFNHHTLALLAVAIALCPFIVAEASITPCLGCKKLWELQPIYSGVTIERLNQASGYNHSELVLINGDTSADLPLAQIQFVRDTLISSEEHFYPGLYLGAYPQRLLVGQDVVLTLQGLVIRNVVANFSLDGRNSSPGSGVNGSSSSSWSLSLVSFSQSRGSLLRLVGCRLVLSDCAVAEWMYGMAAAAGGTQQQQQQQPVVNMTQDLAPDVFVASWSGPQLQLEDVLVTCSQVCGPGSSGVRTMRVVTAEALAEALTVVNDNVDGCNGYTIELAANLSLADAMAAGSSRGSAGSAAAWTAAVGRRQRRLSLAPGRRLAAAAAARGAGGLDNGVNATVNLTLRGVAALPSTSTSSSTLGSSFPVVVLDAAQLRGVIRLQPPARLFLERLTLVNMPSPQPGVLALPLYTVDRTPTANATSSSSGSANSGSSGSDSVSNGGSSSSSNGSSSSGGGVAGSDPRVWLRNVTLVLPQDELSYESTWLQASSGVVSSSALNRELAAWLGHVVQEAAPQSLAPDSLSFSRLRVMDLDAEGLRLTSRPPTGFALAQPAIGISNFAATPLLPYPQIVVLNSSAALVSVLNSSSAAAGAAAGGYEIYPGVPTLAAVSLRAGVYGNGTAATVFAPMPYGRIVLRRSYVLGPYLKVNSGSATAAAAAVSVAAPAPVLDLSGSRSAWASWDATAANGSSGSSTSGLILTLRNLTVVGLGSPGRWPAERLVRCLDLPLWSLLEGPRAPSLSGEPPPLALLGATVGVSAQELALWAACYKVLTGGSASQEGQDSGSSDALGVACRSLGLAAFRAQRLEGSTALQIELLQGMGMRLQDVVLRDDIVPYQRYDLEELLPGPTAALPRGDISNPGGGNDSGGASGNRKWVIPVVVVGVVALLSVLLLFHVYLRHRRDGGKPAPYINVHMVKMMANNTLRPYACAPDRPSLVAAAANGERDGEAALARHDSGALRAGSIVAGADARSVESGGARRQFGKMSQARSGRGAGEASPSHTTARVSGEEPEPDGSADVGGAGPAEEADRTPSPHRNGGAGENAGGGAAAGGFAPSAFGAPSAGGCSATAGSAAAMEPYNMYAAATPPWAGLQAAWPAAANGIYDPNRGYGTVMAGPSYGNGNGDWLNWGAVWASALPPDAAAAIRRAAAGSLMRASPRTRTEATESNPEVAGAADVPAPPRSPRGQQLQAHSPRHDRWAVGAMRGGDCGSSTTEGSPSSTRQEGTAEAAPHVAALSSSGSGTAVRHSAAVGTAAAPASPRLPCPDALMSPRASVTETTAAAASVTSTSAHASSGGYGAGMVSRQATASLLTRSVSVEGAASPAPSVGPATGRGWPMLSTEEASEVQELAVADGGGGGSDEGADGDAAGAARVAMRPAASDLGMRALPEHQRLMRTTSAASSLIAVLRLEGGRVWPWSPERTAANGSAAAAAAQQRQEQRRGEDPLWPVPSVPASTDATAAAAPAALNLSLSAGSRLWRSRRATLPSGGDAAAPGVAVGRAAAAVLAPPPGGPGSRRRGSVGLEPSTATVMATPSPSSGGSTAGGSPPSTVAAPVATALGSLRRAGSSANGGRGRRPAAPPPQVPAGAEEAGTESVRATAPANLRGGAAAAVEPAATATTSPRVVRRSPFLVKTSASRLSEATTPSTDSSRSILMPSKTEAGASTAAGAGGASPRPPAAAASGGSSGGAGGQALPPANSEPVRAARTFTAAAAATATAGSPAAAAADAPLAPTTSLGGGAKPGLGRLLVGSLSNLFRVDSLVTGLPQQRAPSPSPAAALTPSGGSLTAPPDRQVTHTGAVQLADVRPGGGSPPPSGGAAAAGISRTGSAAGLALVGGGPSFRGGGAGGRGGGGAAVAAAADLGMALNEITADVESRLNENQLVIQQVLGSGAFGTVYKALWKGLPVAVKTMTLTADAVTQGRHAALMEAALSKSIFHPHVVATYTCDLKPMHVDSRRGGAMTGLHIANEMEAIQEWRLYIVQEFCDGGSLRHAIEARSFLNPDTGAPQMEWVLQMAREIAAGLQYLHEHNIIHGDLNPANVLLRRDEGSTLGYTAKIADFGLSVHMHAEQSHVSNTKRGTPFYTAPEVTHAGNLTRFADVFSYGVVLWELYCSRSCWMYGAQGRLVHQRAFPHLPPTCPPAYSQLVANCMQPAHKQRPTFKQIGLALERMLRDCEYAAAVAAAAAAAVVADGSAAGSGGSHGREALGWSSGGGSRELPLGAANPMSPFWLLAQEPLPSPPPLPSKGQQQHQQQPRLSMELAQPQPLPSPPPPHPHQQQQPPSALQPFQKASGHSSICGSSRGMRSSTSSSTTSLPLPPPQQQQQQQQQQALLLPLPSLHPQAPPPAPQPQHQHNYPPTFVWSGLPLREAAAPNVLPRYDSSCGGVLYGRSGPDVRSIGVITRGVSSAATAVSAPASLSRQPVAAAVAAVVAGEPPLEAHSAPPAVAAAALQPGWSNGAASAAAIAAAAGTTPSAGGTRCQSTSQHGGAAILAAPPATLAAADGGVGTPSALSPSSKAAAERRIGDANAAKATPTALSSAVLRDSPASNGDRDAAVPDAIAVTVAVSASVLPAALLPLPATAGASPGVAGASDSDRGGGGDLPLAGVMRAFEIPAEAPRFTPPDLPTVLEAEDEPTSCTSMTHGTSSLPASQGPSAGLQPAEAEGPLAEAAASDSGLTEGGASIGDRISAGDGGGGAAHAVQDSGARSAPPRRRRKSLLGPLCAPSPSPAAVAMDAATEDAAAAAAMTVRRQRSRTAPATVQQAEAEAAESDAAGGAQPSETGLDSSEFTLLGLAAAGEDPPSPYGLMLAGMVAAASAAAAVVETEGDDIAALGLGSARCTAAADDQGASMAPGHDDSAFSRQGLNDAEAGPAAGAPSMVVPLQSAAVPLQPAPSAPGTSRFARASLGSVAAVPALATITAGGRFSRPSLAAPPPDSHPPEAEVAALAGSAAAAVPAFTSPFMRPSLATPLRPRPPTPMACPFVRPSLGAEPVAAVATLPYPGAVAPAARPPGASPFARPSLGSPALGSRAFGSAAPPPPAAAALGPAAEPFGRPSLQSHGQWHMAPPTPVALPTPGPIGGHFVRPSLGAPAPPPPPIPAAAAAAATATASPFGRPSMGAAAAAAAPVAGAFPALPAPGASPFARPSLGNPMQRALAAPPPPAPLGASRFGRPSLGAPPTLALTDPTQRFGEVGRHPDASAASASTGMATVHRTSYAPALPPFVRPGIGAPPGAAAPYMHAGAGSSSSAPSPFARPTLGSVAVAPGPYTCVCPVLMPPSLVGSSLPALPVGSAATVVGGGVLLPLPYQQSPPYAAAALRGSAAGGAATAVRQYLPPEGAVATPTDAAVVPASAAAAATKPKITPDSASDEDGVTEAAAPVELTVQHLVDKARGALESGSASSVVATSSDQQQQPQPQREVLASRQPQGDAGGAATALTGVHSAAVATTATTVVAVAAAAAAVPSCPPFAATNQSKPWHGAALQHQLHIFGAGSGDGGSVSTWASPQMAPPRSWQQQQAAAPGPGIGSYVSIGGVFGSPVFAALGSEASASGATAAGGGGGAMAPYSSGGLATSLALPGGGRSGPYSGVVGSFGGEAGAGGPAPLLAVPWSEGPARRLPTSAVSYTGRVCGGGSGSSRGGDGLSRSLDSAALSALHDSISVQTKPYGNRYGYGYGPHSAHMPPSAGHWSGRRASAAESHSSGQLGSLPRSYNTPSYMLTHQLRSALGLRPPGSWQEPPGPPAVATTGGPAPPPPLQPPPPRFKRESLRTLGAAATVAAAGASEPDGTAGTPLRGDVAAGDGLSRQPKHPKQPTRQARGQSRGGLLRAIRSAVGVGGRSRLAQTGAAGVPGSDGDIESSGAESGGCGNQRLPRGQPPSFSRRGVSYGSGGDADDGECVDVLGVEGDDGDPINRSRDGEGVGGGGVRDLFAAGSLTAALATPRSHVSAASDLSYMSSSAPSALAPSAATLVGSPAAATPTAGWGGFGPRFARPAIAPAAAGGVTAGGSAAGSAYLVGLAEHAFVAGGAIGGAGLDGGGSFNEALRLAKSSLSTVLESGPSLSQASNSRSSQGSDRGVRDPAPDGGSEGSDRFGRLSRRNSGLGPSFGRGSAGNAPSREDSAASGAVRPRSVGRRTHGSPGRGRAKRPAKVEQPRQVTAVDASADAAALAVSAAAAARGGGTAWGGTGGAAGGEHRKERKDGE